jgi:hypothetical protein
LVDALDLGSSDESCGGSSPSARTTAQDGWLHLKAWRFNISPRLPPVVPAIRTIVPEIVVVSFAGVSPWTVRPAISEARLRATCGVPTVDGAGASAPRMVARHAGGGTGDKYRGGGRQNCAHVRYPFRRVILPNSKRIVVVPNARGASAFPGSASDIAPLAHASQQIPRSLAEKKAGNCARLGELDILRPPHKSVESTSGSCD